MGVYVVSGALEPASSGHSMNYSLQHFLRLKHISQWMAEEIKAHVTKDFKPFCPKVCWKNYDDSLLTQCVWTQEALINSITHCRDFRFHSHKKISS